MNIFKNLLKSFFIIFFYIIFSLFLINFLNQKTNFSLTAVMTLPYVILFFVLFCIFKKDLISDFKNFTFEKFKVALRFFLYSFATMLAINMVISNFYPNLPANEIANRELLTKLSYFSILSIGVLVPFLEEVCFRLNIKKAITNKYLFVVLSSFIFAFLHILSFEINELIHMVSYFTVGLFFAIAYLKTNNIFTSITMHIIHNCLIIILFLTGVQ
jgi:membrane protease YdiL (CAAX protease family)